MLSPEQKKVFEGHSLEKVLHLSAEHGNTTTYRCEALGLTKSVFTPKGDYNKETQSRFGSSESVYFLDGDTAEYKTLSEIADKIIAQKSEGENG